MQQQTVAAAVHALTADQTLTARDSGFQFARNQLANVENAQTFARMLGTAPSFAQWEESRLAWVSGYVEANPDNTGNAADKAWNRFASLLNDLFGLTKPKAASEAAVKKAAERAEKQEKLLAAYQDQTPLEIRAEIERAYQTLSQNPTHKDSLKKVKELDKVLKVKQSAENKEHGARLAELRKDAAAEIKACTSIEALEKVIELLIQYQ